jgi:hypothetical protein
MKDDDGCTVVALNVSLLGANPERRRVEKIFGKNKFNICYVCQLKSLGIKPSKGNAQ